MSQLLPVLDAGKTYGDLRYTCTWEGSDTRYQVVDPTINSEGLLCLSVHAANNAEEKQIGSFTITVESENYNDFTLTVCVNAINQLTPTGKPILSTSEITYGEAVNDIALSGTMQYGEKTVEGSFAWVDGTVKPNAGSYDATWKFTPVSTIYREVTGKTTIQVNQAASACTAPTGITGLVYNPGKSQQLVTAGTASGGTMQYSLEKDGTYTNEICTGTEAKEYFVWYKVKGDENHKDTVPASVKVTIAPKPVSDPVIVVTSGSVYNGREQTPAVLVKDGATVIPASEYTVSYRSNINAGMATVILNDKTGGNYTVNGSAPFTIAQADAPKLNDVAHSQKYTMTTEQTVSLKNVGIPLDAGALTYTKGTERKTGSVIVDKWDVDSTGRVQYTLTGGQTGDTVTLSVRIGSTNYAKTTVRVIITLTDQEKPTVYANAITLSYTGSAVPANQITGTAKSGETDVAGTWSWKDGQVLTNVSDSGTKTVVFTPADQVNYRTVETTVLLTIQPATLTGVSVSQTGTLTYNGTAQQTAVQTKAAAVNGQKVTFTYCDTQDGTYGELPKFTKAGKHTVYFSASAPNHAAYNGTLTVTIAKADPKCAAPGDVTAVYGDTLGKITLTNPNGNTPGTWTWVNDAQVVGDVGSRAFQAIFTPDDAENYNVKSKIDVIVTITKAESVIAIAPAEKTLIYTGSAQALVNRGVTADGTILYSLHESGTYTEDIPTGIKAGKYTVYYKVKGDKNHNDTTPAFVKVTIAKQPVAIPEADTTAFTYNGKNQTYTIEANDNFTVAGNVKKNAGTYTVTVALKDTENFIWSDNTEYTFIIASAQVILLVIDKSVSVNDMVPDLSRPVQGVDYTVIGLFGNDKLAAAPLLTYDPSIPDTSRTGDAAVIRAGGAYAGDNYVITYVAGKLTVIARPSSDSSTAGKTEIIVNPDGSTTQTETKADGTVVKTTIRKDGSATKTETRTENRFNGTTVETVIETRTEADGTRTETKSETKTDASGVITVTESSRIILANGSTGTTTTTTENGISRTEAEIRLSDKAVSDARKSEKAVLVPTEVKPGKGSSSAPIVKIDLPKNAGETKMEIPVRGATAGTVAVIVKRDGTEKIVKNSIPTRSGIQFTVDGDVTVKIIDNAKDFIDIRDHWAKDSIDFVSARGLVNGTSESTFSPDAATIRAQLWTILARQQDADLTGGSTWYEKAQKWAMANGISNGSDPDGALPAHRLSPCCGVRRAAQR